MKRTVYYFEDETLAELDKLAKSSGLSRASIVRTMVRYMIPRWKDAYDSLKNEQEPYNNFWRNINILRDKNGS